MKKWAEVLAPYVPLLQTVVWIVSFGVVALLFRSPLRSILDAIRKRIERGSSFKAGPFEVGQDLRRLEYVEPVPLGQIHPEGRYPEGDEQAEDWAEERNTIYDNNRGVFITHVLEPSDDPAQKYDIFIYLVRHKSNDYSDIEFAEFFLGHYWGNKVFREKRKNGLIGVSTAAYGPFLCTCRVRFKDGYSASIHRYIDFEMGRVFNRASKS